MDVVVIDNDYIEYAKKMKKQCSEINDIITGYKSCLTKIANSVIVSGAVHEATVVYISYVCLLQDVALELGKKIEQLCSDFIRDIDDADDYLYEGKTQERYFTEDEYKKMVDMLDKPLHKLTDGAGDLLLKAILNVCDFFKIKEISGFSLELQENKKLLFDLKNTTKSNLDDIYRWVNNIDRSYGNDIQGGVYEGNFYTSKFGYIVHTLLILRDALFEMKEIISPDNGMFTPEQMNVRLASILTDLHQYLDETIAINETELTEEIAKIFVSNPQNENWFFKYRDPINDEIANLTKKDLANMAIFEGVEVSTSYLADRFSVPKRVETLDIYAYLQIKKQLAENITKMAENEIDISDYTEYLEKAKDIIDAIKKHKEDYPDYKKYKKIYKVFDRFLDKVGEVGDVIGRGLDLTEIIAPLFANYQKNQEIIVSLSNGVEKNSLLEIAIEDLKENYNNKFLAATKEFVEYVYSEIIKKGSEDLKKIVSKGILKIYTFIDTAKDVVGELTGLGGRATTTLDFICISQSLNGLEGAYQHNFEKVSSGNYEKSDVTNLSNSFKLLKRTYVKCYQLLAQKAESSGDAMKQSYYWYLSKSINGLQISKENDIFNFVSYDDYVKLHF